MSEYLEFLLWSLFYVGSQQSQAIHQQIPIPVQIGPDGQLVSWGHEKTLSSAFATSWDSNRPAQLIRLARVLKFRLYQVEVLSRQRTTKALIRLCRCACWFAMLLFAYVKSRFSHDVAHIWAGKWQNQQNDEGHCEDPNPPGHPSSQVSLPCTLWVV